MRCLPSPIPGPEWHGRSALRQAAHSPDFSSAGDSPVLPSSKVKNAMSVICPLCEQGELHESDVIESIRHGDSRLEVKGIEVMRCDSCGEETVMPNQARRNALRFVDAKRTHDGLMTSQEIVDWRRQLGITQHEAARLLGGGVNAFSKYERGEVTQSHAMDRLMRVSLLHSNSRRYLFDCAGLECKAAAWLSAVNYEDAVSSIETESNGRYSHPARAVLRQSKFSEEYDWKELKACNGQN